MQVASAAAPSQPTSRGVRAKNDAQQGSEAPQAANRRHGDIRACEKQLIAKVVVKDGLEQ